MQLHTLPAARLLQKTILNTRFKATGSCSQDAEHILEFSDHLTHHLVHLPLIISTLDRKSTRLNSSHIQKSRMPSSA